MIQDDDREQDEELVIMKDIREFESELIDKLENLKEEIGLVREECRSAIINIEKMRMETFQEVRKVEIKCIEEIGQVRVEIEKIITKGWMAIGWIMIPLSFCIVTIIMHYFIK